jgi:hypothetical protein
MRGQPFFTHMPAACDTNDDAANDDRGRSQDCEPQRWSVF